MYQKITDVFEQCSYDYDKDGEIKVAEEAQEFAAGVIEIIERDNNL